MKAKTVLIVGGLATAAAAFFHRTYWIGLALLTIGVAGFMYWRAK